MDSNNFPPKASEDIKCHICSKKCNIQSQLTHHLKNRHPEVETPFVCSSCPDKSYKTLTELNLHLGKEHSDEFQLAKQGNKIYVIVKKLQCPHCPNKFTSPSVLKTHITSHTKVKSYGCDICGAKFRYKFDIRKHKSGSRCQSVLEAGLGKGFKCNICEVAYKSKTSLKNHMKIIHGIDLVKAPKPVLICLFCGYKAPNSSLLTRHNAIHITGEKLFECKDCNAKFGCKSNLNAHIRSQSRCPAKKAVGIEAKRGVKFSKKVEEVAESQSMSSNIEDVDSKKPETDRISSWVKNVTNNSSIAIVESDYCIDGVIPTTVLKMEH